MKEQLIQYVELLFAGTTDSEEIKQEILQNTLDRYDDLVDSGKSPEAAYRLAITGIGDISEIMNGGQGLDSVASMDTSAQTGDISPAMAKMLRAVAVGLYITCVIPLFLLGNQLGLCFMFLFIGVATALIIFSGRARSEARFHRAQAEAHSPRKVLKRSIRSMIFAIGLAVYFIISFTSGAWYVTWVIFPLIGAVSGLITACIDLKEVN